MRVVMQVLAILLTINVTWAATTPATSLLDKIKNDPDLSQFYDLLERDPLAMANLNLRSLTFFAPTNEALQKYTGNVHLLYHMTTTAITLEQLRRTIITDFDGNPPLYITKILHVIDDVMTPLTVTSSHDGYNTDAFRFLTHANSSDIGGHRIKSYLEKVISNGKESVYQAMGWHTFFIPVDDGFESHLKPDMIDKKVIDGHLIPDKVLFTASAPTEEPFVTLAMEDNIKVTISFFTQGEGTTLKTYVKSDTVVGDSEPSTVTAEIVRANFPVRNGVVHLIDRPLIIMDTTTV